MNDTRQVVYNNIHTESKPGVDVCKLSVYTPLFVYKQYGFIL